MFWPRRPRWRGLNADDPGIANVGDAPDAPRLVIGDEKRAVRSYSEPGWTVRRPARLLIFSGETVGKDHVRGRRLAVGQRLENDVIASCGPGARFHEPWKAINAPPA